MSFKWDYDKRTCDVSMLGYIERVLTRFQHPIPTHKQHSSPHKHNVPQYGAKHNTQTTPTTSPHLTPLTPNACRKSRNPPLLCTCWFHDHCSAGLSLDTNKFIKGVMHDMVECISLEKDQEIKNKNKDETALNKFAHCWSGSHENLDFASLGWYTTCLSLYVICLRIPSTIEALETGIRYEQWEWVGLTIS